MTAFAHFVTLMTAAVFVLAALHKASALASRSAGAEPVVRTITSRATAAATIVAVAFASEVATIAGLLLWPSIGHAAAGALLVTYAWALRRLPPQVSCRCLGPIGDTRSRFVAILRNVTLLALNVGALIAYLVGEDRLIPPDVSAVAAALAGLGILAALATLPRLPTADAR
jgi:hypothetical protein